MTKSNESRHRKLDGPSPPVITARQERALMVLLGGGDDSAAAEAAGVTRPTVNKWKNHDANFIAAMNLARADVVAGFHDGLRALYPAALDALRDALDPDQSVNARLRAAEAIIKNAAPPDGEVDPEAIKTRWAKDRAEVMHDRELTTLFSPLNGMFD